MKRADRPPLNTPDVALGGLRNFQAEMNLRIAMVSENIDKADPMTQEVYIKSLREQITVWERCREEARLGVERVMASLEAETTGE